MGNKATRISAGVAFAIITALVLLGCQSQPAAQAPPTQAPAKAPAAAPTQAAAPAAQPTAAPAAQPTAAPPTAQPAETLKIGILASLTGPSSRNGTNIERFILMAIDDINAKGGFVVGGKTYKLQGVTADDKSTTEGGRDAANRLALAEKVSYVVGGLGAASSAAQTVTEPSKIMLFAASSPDANLGPKFPLTMVSTVHPNVRIEAYYAWLKKNHPEMKTVAIVRSNDNAGVAYTPTIEKAAKANGFEVAGVEYYPMDLKDFTPIMARVLRLKPDGIDYAILGRGPHMLAMAKILAEQGFKGPTFGVSADVSALKEGAQNMEGLTTPILADWRAEIVSAPERAIYERYIQKFAEAELEPTTLSNYAAVQMLVQAMGKAGTVSDTEKVVSVLREGEWDTVFSKWGKARFVGQQTFGAKVTFEQPMYFSGVRNGKVGTFDAMVGTMR